MLQDTKACYKKYKMIFTEQETEALVKRYFLLDAKAKALTGEYEFNF